MAYSIDRFWNVLIVIGILFSGTIVLAHAKEKEKVEIEATISVISLPASDSITLQIRLQIKDPAQQIGKIEIRYGTKEEGTDLAAFNLELIREDTQLFLANNQFKFPIENGIVNIHSRGVEKKYWQQHDRYFDLKAKDFSGKEVEHITKKEFHK